MSRSVDRFGFFTRPALAKQFKLEAMNLSCFKLFRKFYESRKGVQENPCRFGSLVNFFPAAWELAVCLTPANCELQCKKLNRMSEIVIATIMRPVGESGLQTHFQQFAQYLREGRFPFALVTPFDAPRALVYPTFALRKPFGALNGSLNVWWYMHWHALFLQYALAKYLSDGTPRIVYAQNPPSALAALRARANPSQRVVMAVHFNKSEADEWAEKGLIPKDGLLYRRIRANELAAFQHVDAIVHFSQFMNGMLHKELAMEIDGLRCEVIPNFITDPLNAGPPQKMSADLINVGTFEPRKNQSFILDLLAAARQRGHLLTATLIGDGPTRREIEAKADRLSLNDQVRFLGHVQHAATKMRGHRAYIHAARVENLPFVLLEAMARGLPIFAPPVGGIPEIYQDGVEGQYLSLDDPIDSAAKVLKVLTNPALLAQMGAASRTRFLRCYETNIVAPRLLAFLRKVQSLPKTEISHPRVCRSNL